MTENSVCGFWNHSLYATSGGWSTKGCQRTDVEDGLVVCECDHLTNFAILLASHNVICQIQFFNLYELMYILDNIIK